MFSIIFWSFSTAIITGLAIKFVLDQQANTTKSITWLEFAIASIAICLVIGPSVSVIGWKLVRNSMVTYNQYLNGWELTAIKNDIPCSRDGPCSHEYDCDPYIVMVPYSCNCDSKGNCSTCYRPETRYHSCPYVDVETDYTVKTTLGEFEIDTHRLPNDPQKHRWRKEREIPQYVIDRAGIGEHPFWSRVKERIAQGKPGPVTTRGTYENYVLASDRTILKQYSAEIKKFKDAGLLPELDHGVHDFYYADKVYFVGFQPIYPSSWQNAVAYLNSALGMELQGDLHIVLVRNSTITQDPETYALALRAYWLNNKEFKKDAFAKNAIAVVIGTTNGKTISWARAFTGMPIGNERLAVAVQNHMEGIGFTPEATIGSIRGWFDQGTVRSAHSAGALENIIWGLSNPDTRFRRYSMSGKTGYGGGFLYLKNEIQPSSTAKFWIAFTVFLFSTIVWVVVAVVGDDYSKYKRSQPRRCKYNG